MLLIVAMFFIIALLLIGTPVAFALGASASLLVLIFSDASQLDQFSLIAFTMGTSSNQLIAPLFVLMAEFLSGGGVAADIFTILNDKMRRFKAGLAVGATLASTVFAALCGSSSATVAAIGRISIGEMIKKGYQPAFVVGTVMSGGTLGIMIPPSLTFVFYGIITQTNIAKLLMAGLLPGLMISILLCIFIIIRAKLNPALVGVTKDGKAIETTEEQKAAMLEVLKNANNQDNEPIKVEGANLAEKKSFRNSTFTRAGLPIILILAVFISMYTGLATADECAGIGAIGALLIVIIEGRLNRKVFLSSLSAAARTSVMILFMAICGFALTYIVSYLGIASEIAAGIAESGLNKWVVMILVYILWMVLGCLMDPGSMVILTVPFILPALNGLGFETIWIGVVSTLLVEVGMVTPPVGLNLFVCKTITGLPYGTLVRGQLPFLFVFLIALILLTVFPQIALFLPSRM